MEDLTRRCDRLSLSAREGKGRVIEETSGLRLCFGYKGFYEEIVEHGSSGVYFPSLWRTKESFKVTNAGSNTLLFAFDLEVDADKVLLGEPWSYDRHLVVLQHFDGSKSISKLEFKTCSFWVQIHDLPFKYMTLETAIEIGEAIGPVTIS